MKFFLLRLFFLITIFVSGPTVAGNITLAIQATAEQSEPPHSYDDDVSPGMLFFLVIGGLIVFTGLGIGIALIGAAILAVLGFISIGIVSTSLLVGFHKRSFTKGFRIFILLCSVAGGAIGGGVLCGFLNYLLKWNTTTIAVLVGVAAGLLAGAIFGLIANYIFRKFALYLKTKYATRFGTNELTRPT